MHDIDRTHLELEQSGYELGYEQEHEQFLGGIVGGVTGSGPAAPLHDTREMELAVELLEVANEQELEQFLGNVFSSVGDALGRFVRSDTGRALSGILKDAARQALPVVSRAVGDRIDPAHGGEWGGRIAQAAGSLLGLELEGLSPQDQEFEAARQFVRFASAAAQHAALAPPTLTPETVAHAAATAAAHRFAPGLAHEVGPRRAATTQPYRPAAQRAVVRDHRRPWVGPAATAQRPVYQRPAYRRPLYQRPLYQRPVYGRPAYYAPRPYAAWRPAQAVGYRGPYGYGWPRYGYAAGVGPQWASWLRPAAGYPGGARWWQYGYPGRYGAPWRLATGWPRTDWAQFRVFLGDAPPAAPPGAPGRWVYRGHRHGRRRWAWIPYPGAAPFPWPPVQPDWPGGDGAPDGGGFPPSDEPPFFGPPDQTAVVTAPVDMGAGVVASAPAPPGVAAPPVGEPAMPFAPPSQAPPSQNGAPPAGAGLGGPPGM